MTFVTLNEDQFKAWANKAFAGKYDLVLPKYGKETVIKHKIPSTALEIHIYTTLVGGVTRDIGDDAIRSQLFDVKSGRIVEAEKKILRTEGATTVWDRLDERVKELRSVASSKTFCKKCGAHLVERTNRKTGEIFMGCSAYPNCGNNQILLAKYPLATPTQATQTSVGPTLASALQRPTAQGSVQGYNAAAPMFAASRSEAYSAPYAPVKAKERVRSKETELVSDEELVPTSKYPLHQYKFEKFNRVQSTILKEGFWQQDANLVLGTATSTGKTISAELFMRHTLKEGKKILYSAPLKALSEEKLSDWTESFPDYKISIMTGDYGTIDDKKAGELKESNILIMTSEMVDSRTRNHNSEKSDWIQDVGLLVVDESHIISTSRGHAVEAGIMRFSKLNPNARILLLSATMPNVEDFKQWLTTLNSKETYVINNGWRPTVLNWHYEQHDILGYYNEIEASKREIAINLVQQNPTQKFLVFVHTKNTGRHLAASFNEMGIQTNFHNAELDRKERLDIENSFKNRENGMRVLISTSTLAWGVNLPARNVIIVGTTRGMDTVDELDIIQESGRAGRLGIDDAGDCYLICDDPQRWERTIKNPRNVDSTLMDQGVLGFHILAEMKNNEIWNKDTLYKWFDRTLAKIQLERIDNTLVERVLSQLQNWGMMTNDNGIYKITRLGRVSATLYYMPEDVHHWAMNFDKIMERNLWDDDMAIAYAIGGTPSIQTYIPRAEQEAVDDYMHQLRKVLPTAGEGSLIAKDLWEYIAFDEDDKKKPISIRSLQQDIDRITQACQWIDGIKRWSVGPFWKALPIRVKQGVAQHLIELCSLPGIGAVRAKKLYKEGIKTLQDVNANRTLVKQIVGNTVGDKVITAARTQSRLQAGGE